MARLRLTRARAALAAAVLAALAAGAMRADGHAPAPRQDTSAIAGAEDHPAIAYAEGAADDQIVRLDDDLRQGRTRLAFDPRLGYLPSLLGALGIPESSQLAVFSKTSLQARQIGPATPRTIFFNDRTVVAWPRGGFIEIAAQDARRGVAFYTLSQDSGETPRFSRPRECLSCHVSAAALDVPGLLVRSVATEATGTLAPHVWNSTTTHASPVAERWAGWYVTGGTGTLAHLGNQVVAGSGELRASPSSLASLAPRVDAARYATPYSDVAALLVFDHQMHAMNVLTRAGWDVRIAEADRAPDLAATVQRSAAALVDVLLFAGAPRLEGGIESTSGFVAAFAAAGPRDRRGRSLRELALDARLFRYPCSYMIYAPAFDGLPDALKDATYRRLAAVLAGTLETPASAALTAADRRAIAEILRDTKPDAARYF